MPRPKSYSRRQNRKKSELVTNLKDSTSIEQNVMIEKESYQIIQDLKNISGKVISDKRVKINAPEYMNLLNNWLTFINNMNIQLNENLKDLQNDYERMFRGYLGQTTDFWENLQLFSLSDTRSQYSEIEGMQNKLEQLENRLNKLEKK